MDFSHNQDDFVSYFSPLPRQLSRASDYLMGMVDHWKTLSTQYGNFAKFDKAQDGHSIHGSIFTKSFVLNVSPISRGEEAFAEAVLSIRKVDGELHQMGSFYVSADGAFFNSQGEEVISRHADFPGYKLFTVIVRAVMEESITA